MNGTENLRGRLSERIRDSIVSGDLPPGSRINETKLSAIYGVSRTPLREALFTLEGSQLLENDPQRGFFVTPLSSRDVRELYPLGRTLDMLAVRTAGEMRGATLEQLAAINAEFRASHGDAEAARLADRRFHELIVDRCPNRRLLAILESVQLGIERYERLYMSDADDLERSARGHDEIIDAFRRNRIDDVEHILSDIWDYTGRRLIAALGEIP